MMTHEDIVFEMAKLVVYEYVKGRIQSPKFAAQEEYNINIDVNYIMTRTYEKAWKNGVSRKDTKKVLQDKSYIVQLAEVIQKNLITTCKMELIPDCQVRVSYYEYKRMTLPFIVFPDVFAGRGYSEDNVKSMVRRIDDRIEAIKKVYRCNWVDTNEEHYDFENVKYD